MMSHGLAYFYPSIKSKQGGVLNQATILAGIDPLDYIEGLHMRFRPDSTKPVVTMKSKVVEVIIRMVIAALTAFLTAIGTTSCMGYGPLSF